MTRALQFNIYRDGRCWQDQRAGFKSSYGRLNKIEKVIEKSQLCEGIKEFSLSPGKSRANDTKTGN